MAHLERRRALGNKNPHFCGFSELSRTLTPFELVVPERPESKRAITLDGSAS
jgi:hypothetical protein